MAYNVYLFNGLGISASGSGGSLTGLQILTINQVLQGYFAKVVSAHDRLPGRKPYGSAQVQWLASFPDVKPHELLIYLLPSGSTLVTNGRIEVGRPSHGHDGRTNSNLDNSATNTPTLSTGSEVYLHDSDPMVIANLMFHEAMHNKLYLDNKALHPLGGLAKSPVTPSTHLSQSNINHMAAALGSTRPQWTKGIRILSARAMLPDNDPSKGIF